MTRVPRGVVHAIRVFLKCSHTGGPVNGPEFNRVIPGRCDERIPSSWVIIGRVDFATMFVEGAYGIGCWREGRIVDLDGSIGDGGDQEGVVGFGPCEVVNTVRSVEGDEFG